MLTTHFFVFATHVHRNILDESASSFGIGITLPGRPDGKYELPAEEETSPSRQISGAPKLLPSQQITNFSPHHFIPGKGLMIKHEFLRSHIRKLVTILTELCWLGCDMLTRI